MRLEQKNVRERLPHYYLALGVRQLMNPNCAVYGCKSFLCVYSLSTKTSHP
jgi:hypothetical protein